ncbi:MAG: hypothetical protein Q8R88_01155, partial [Desulfoprunum sp.]|nr:hypothetical protein [Desulfoprunum sp.]
MNYEKWYFKQYVGQSTRLCFILVTLLVLLACLSRTPATAAMTKGERPPVITWQKLENLLGQRTFKSQEELFQLLYILYAQEKYTAFRLEK